MSSSENEWRVEGFSVATKEGPNTIAGWRWKMWALDFRVYYDDGDDEFYSGWAITHVPTGKIAGGALVDLDRAKEFVRQYDALGDWSATTSGVEFAAGVRAIRDASNGDLVLGAARFGPNFRYSNMAEKGDA